MEYISKVTDAAIADAKAKNPNAKLCVIEATLDDGNAFEGIFINPSNESIAKYVSNNQKTSGSGNKDSLRNHTSFVMENILFPTRDEYFEIAKRLPLLAVSLCNELLSGSGIATESKKKTL